LSVGMTTEIMTPSWRKCCAAQKKITSQSKAG